jgi:hypothetical protein
MGRLITRIGLMLVIVSVAGVIVIQFMGDKVNTYLQASTLKQTLLKAKSSPALILVGGSNVAFGFDSEFLAKELGRDVINMGLHGDLGLRYMLNEVEKEIAHGDVIVVSPEYEHFFGSVDPNGRILTQVVLSNPSSLKVLAVPEDFLTLIAHLYLPFKTLYSYYIAGFTNSGTIYTKENFNSRGDFIIPGNSNDTLYEPKAGRTLGANRSMNGEVVDLLNSFNTLVKSKEARVLLAFPPIPEPEYDSMEDELGSLAATLQKQLEMELLSMPVDNVFPLGDFYDTRYHLNETGRSLRSRQLATEINQAIGGNES